jgi:hypothetical protein
MPSARTFKSSIDEGRAQTPSKARKQSGERTLPGGAFAERDREWPQA